MYPHLSVEVIGTLLVARKSEGVFCRQTLALEYGVFRKAYSIYLLPSVPCVLSVSVCPSSVRWGRRPCPFVVRFPDWGGCPQFFHELEFYCEEFNRRVYISGTLWTEFILMEKHLIDAQGHILEHKKLYQDKNSSLFKENIWRE